MKNYIIVIALFATLFVAVAGSKIFLDSEKQNDQRVVENTQQAQENKKLAGELSATKDRLSIIETAKSELTTAEIVQEWSPQVVHIICSWYYSDGTFYTAASGSGFLTTFRDHSMSVMTNRHVILDEDKYAPKFCTVYFQNDEKYIVYWNSSAGGWSTEYDKANIILTGLSQNVKNLIKRTDGYYCVGKPDIGDKIVVLGYPGIGSTNGVTVTEGIISGSDGDYYITDAKIDYGSSGGIAVSAKNNCIVGMPTLSVSSKIESLGRILSSEVILK